MLSRRLAIARPLRSVLSVARPITSAQQRGAAQAAPTGADYPHLTEAEDPGQNGGYINPPLVKRQFRDPYGDWWDKQERRNYGEPVHEDNDILGLFSPEEYTHVKPRTAFLQIGSFVLVVLGLCGTVAMFYPDKPSAPKEYEDGLVTELGGPKGLRTRAPGDPFP